MKFAGILNETGTTLNENAFHSFVVAKQIFLWQLPQLHDAIGSYQSLRLHLHGCSKLYVEVAAQDYLHTTKTESLSDRIKDLEKFRTYFRTYEAHLLQLDGVSERWRKVRDMTLEVGDIICWMEQLLCEAMTGILTFQAGYLAKGFAYQRV